MSGTAINIRFPALVLLVHTNDAFLFRFVLLPIMTGGATTAEVYWLDTAAGEIMN